MISNQEKVLKQVLGGTYGGPSLSFDEATSEFIIYTWTDAPVSMDEIARDKLLDQVLLLASREFHKRFLASKARPVKAGK